MNSIKRQSYILALGTSLLAFAFVFFASGIPAVHAATTFNGAYADEVFFSAVVDEENADNVLGAPDGSYADLSDNITVGFGTSENSFDYGVEIPEETDLIIVDQGTEMPNDADRANFGYNASEQSEGDAGLPDGEMHRASLLGSAVSSPGLGTPSNILFYDIDKQDGFDAEAQYGNDFFIAVEGTSNFEIDSFHLNNVVEEEESEEEGEEGETENDDSEASASSGGGGAECVNCGDDNTEDIDDVDEDTNNDGPELVAIGGDPEGAILGASITSEERERQEMQETIDMLRVLVNELSITVDLVLNR